MNNTLGVLLFFFFLLSQLLNCVILEMCLCICMVLYAGMHLLSLGDSRECGDFFQQLNQSD